jgi:hypothetical protein
MPKMSQRQSLVSIEGIEGLWATRSGGDVSADVSPVWDGGADHPEQMAGPASSDNITVTRPMDEIRDLGRIKELRKTGVGRFVTTITEQHTTRDLFPIGEPDVWPEALLVRANVPEYDAGSSDPKVVELEFAISQFA